MSSFLPSIEEFNHLPVESQQMIISSQLINNASGEEKANLAKVLNLLEYLNENNDQGSGHLFSILYQNKEKSLEKVIFHINEIELSRQATKSLNSKDRLNSAEFKNLLSNFETVSLEIEYPSSVFDIIYNQLLNLKTEVSTKTKIIISVYINGIEQKTDKKFIKNENIGIIRFGKTVKTITEGRSHDQGSFFYCSSLTLISIPSSVTSIGDYAFRDCLRLTQIEFEFPSSVASIGDFAFYNCLRLTQITIPSSVTSIGRCAFHFCRSLTQVTIPSSVTSIGDYTFLDEFNTEENYENFFKVIKEYQMTVDNNKLKSILLQINVIGKNHQRINNFISKIEQILEKMKKDIHNYLSNSEIFNIFNQVKEFGVYVNRNNISLDSYIEKSIFETNIILNLYFNLKLIEYASFYGSMDIIRFMRVNGNVELTSNMWIYAIHSRNAELIKYLEDNHVSPPDNKYERILEESSS